jgi:hypothetical protein
MSLSIHVARDVSPRRMRDLVAEGLAELLGEGSRLWDEMPPVDERCLGAIDGRGELVLVSFDAAESERALLAGLRCMGELTSDLAVRLLRLYSRPAQLLVLGPSVPPAAALLAARGLVRWGVVRVVDVNGELGLLVDSLSGAEQTAASTPHAEVEEDQPAAPESGLTTDEERFFQAL